MVNLNEFSSGEFVEWYEWQTKKIDKPKQTDKGTEGIKTVTITLKETVNGTLQHLTDDFQEELRKICKHLYNRFNQYKALRILKEKITINDALLHFDFSEKFSGKYASEVQSMHFGASQTQISLHTGVLYTCEGPRSFCTISDNLKHGTPGIWGHMKPILHFVKERYTSVDNLFILSDGPTTQYRCKENFYLLSKIPLDMGFKSVKWSFLEAGHGKGPPDGVGAAIKHAADTSVLQWSDITNAQTLFKCLSDKYIDVELFLVEGNDIERIEALLKPMSIKTVSGTMKIHQVIYYTYAKYSYIYRNI
jgi:hypothetical protein